MIVFHVTLLERLTKILKDGICPNKTQIWVKRAGSFPKGYTYFFTDYSDAVRWAFKTDWELNESSKLGVKRSVIILTVESGAEFEKDTHIERAFGYQGKWLKTREKIPVHEIMSITLEPIWRKDARNLTAL